MEQERELIPAATVVVMRDSDGGPPDLLMVERAPAMRFAGGALVFPGGRIDAGDHALAATLPGDPEDMAARIAAIRETLEEAGVAIGLDGTADAVPALRAALHGGTAMGPALAEARAIIEPHALVPFARWVPPTLRHSRVFDTRFYLCRAPEGAEPLVDGSENVRAFWAPAREVLDAADRGEATVIFPTRRNLERLARFASFAEAVADAAAHPVETIMPWYALRDGVEHLCIPEGIGYPVTSEPLATAMRG